MAATWGFGRHFGFDSSFVEALLLARIHRVHLSSNLIGHSSVKSKSSQGYLYHTTRNAPKTGCNISPIRPSAAVPWPSIHCPRLQYLDLLHFIPDFGAINRNLEQDISIPGG